MKNKRIVVTGGAGFIGSNLVHTLCKENQVTLIDDLSTGHIENIKGLIDMGDITFVKRSITDLAVLQKTFKDVDYVFHEAAIASVPQSIKDPIASNNVNINGTLNVLVAARDNSVEKVVCASSCAVYGNPSVIPIKESNRLDPLSPYSISKMAGEYYCQVFTTLYNLSTVSLRYFNVYGPRQDPLGEYAAVIPKFITRVANGKPPVIYGDGKQTRDFVFVDDVVKANILAAESSVSGVFNIANGMQVSVNDLAKLVMKAIGKKMDPIYDDPCAGDVRYSLADVSKSRKELNFNACFSLLKGLKKTVNWFGDC